MWIYITDAQIPELAEFSPEARRFLRRCAVHQMFAEHPSLRWLPNGLCGLGVLVGLFTSRALPHSVYDWADEMTRTLLPTAYIFSLAVLGGFLGAQWLMHRARRYLRHLISSEADDPKSVAKATPEKGGNGVASK
jgi:hypothetical protein